MKEISMIISFFSHFICNYPGSMPESSVKNMKKILAPLSLYLTLRSNVKFSLLKLLCTLARLCKGTPLQPLILDLFRSTFPHILSHNCHLSILSGKTKKQGEMRSDPMSTLRSPTLPPQRHHSPPHLQIIW